MTEHDDKENTPVELLRGRETQSGMWFRLGVFFLAALMFISLFLVGGSLSIITSSGNVLTSGISLKVAGFDVTDIEIVENVIDPIPDYEEKLALLYAFEITNKSEVNITYDMRFVINIAVTDVNDEPYGDRNDISGIKFMLVGGNDNITICEDETAAAMTIEYSTEDSGNKFFLMIDDPATIVLAANYSDCYANDTIKISVSGTIDITVNQA